MKSNIEWKKWGERDPLYAVSTWKGKHREGPAPWTDADFYELGRSDWCDFHKHWEQYGLDRECCVEIGCGAGRITKQLSLCFDRVKALDVSEHQLEYARAKIAASNIDFFLTDGVKIPLTDGLCSAAFSTHVFQHFDSHEDAFRVFREIHRVLRKDGTLMIHLPIYQLPDIPIAPLFRAAVFFLKRVGDVRATCNRRLLTQGKWKFVMRRLRFERPQLIVALQSMGFKAIEFRNFPLKSNGDYHEFVLAIKAHEPAAS